MNLRNLITQVNVSTPFLLVCQNDLEDQQVFLCIDRQLITEVSMENSVLLLLSAFYVFNICYPKGCNNVFSFLEFIFFGVNIDKLAPSVKQFFTYISSSV